MKTNQERMQRLLMPTGVSPQPKKACNRYQQSPGPKHGLTSSIAESEKENQANAED